MNHNDIDSVLKWLQQKPPFSDLCLEFPDEWQKIHHELAVVLSSGKSLDVQQWLHNLGRIDAISVRNGAYLLKDSRQQKLCISQIVSNEMANRAVKQHYIALASGVESGKVRFNRFNAFIAQALLFEDGLIRKPVSYKLFKFLWPIVWQKRFLMPLVQPEGIYCFYTQELLVEMARLFEKMVCVELAAGDGTLTRFLRDKGVDIMATDDYSWSHSIDYPDFVKKIDAKEVLKQYHPQVVVCSWPPALNSFEKQIFVTKSVEMYFVIGSKHRFAAGNWEVYHEQNAFEFKELTQLSSLVLPPELDSAVYLFTRKSC